MDGPRDEGAGTGSKSHPEFELLKGGLGLAGALELVEAVDAGDLLADVHGDDGGAVAGQPERVAATLTSSGPGRRSTSTTLRIGSATPRQS